MERKCPGEKLSLRGIGGTSVLCCCDTPTEAAFLLLWLLSNPAILALLPYSKTGTEGGDYMVILISFIVSVGAGVVSHYICKWLDRSRKKKGQ